MPSTPPGLASVTGAGVASLDCCEHATTAKMPTATAAAQANVIHLLIIGFSFASTVGLIRLVR